MSESLYSKTAISGRWAPGRELALQAGMGVLYFAAGKLGLSLASANSFIAPVWPAAGIALAAMMLLGYGVWPGLLAGSFVLNLTVFTSSGGNLVTVTACSMSVAAGNVLAAVTGAWLVERYAKGRDALLQPHTILLFVAFGAFGSTTLSASSGVLALWLARLTHLHHAGDVWVTWWLADMVGVVLLTPLLLAWATERPPSLNPLRTAEAGGLLGLLLLSGWITFGGWANGQPRVIASCFLLMPLLLWTAFRFGQRGTTIVTFIVACVATVGTLHGRGPLVVANRDTALLLLQDFLGGLAVLLLLLAGDVEQRRRIDAGLRASESRYRQLFENNPQPSCVFDRATLRFLAVNPAALEHYGYSREEFLSMRLQDLLAPDDDAARTTLCGLQERHAGTPSHCRHQKKDGTLIEVEAVHNDVSFDGRQAGILLVQDVTERRHAERQAAAFAELARSLSAASSPKAAAQKILQTADALLGCDGGSLELCPTTSEAWTTVCRTGKKALEDLGTTQLSQELRTRVLKDGAQLTTEPLRDGLVSLNGAAPRVLSQLLVPVREADQVIGILSIRSIRPNAYGEPDLRTLQALADFCGGALDRMRTEAALRESDECLKLALSASQMGIWTMELKKPLRVIAGPQFEAIFGLKPGEFDGSEEAFFTLIHPADQERLRQAISAAMKVDGDLEVEFRILPRDRTLGWLLARGRAYVDSHGQPSRLVGVAIDITAQKQAQQEVLRLNGELEQRVGERTGQLEAINRELEAFSYSVSHDLRAPLRSVRGFCQVLLDRYEGKLDTQGRDFLRRAAESSQHMDTLIEDLLQLSRISRAELRPQTVQLSALAETIANELHQSEPQREVTFVITPGLQALGEERLLRIVLENLLRNAWKFTSKHAKARIEFGRAEEPTPAFFVRDNGAGFDMRYADRLFGVFQRLHSAKEFPGTGVGLATVQRILSRHGGRAWAEGVPQKGATFYFSLPPHEGL